MKKYEKPMFIEEEVITEDVIASSVDSTNKVIFGSEVGDLPSDFNFD